MMTNVKILHEIAEKNGWVVRADTIRFGKQQIMCEGTFDDCMKYALRPLKNWLVASVDVLINGYDEYYGVWFDNRMIRVHQNGYAEALGGRYY